MMHADKYKPGYFPAPRCEMRWAKKDHIEKPPIWCSVDLRDGNQSLIVPMSLEEKLDFFRFLVKLGFKEIEVGFPAASETEYEFLRALIEQHLIPDDVTVQVLTQCRDHIIRRTFDALKGAPSAVVHFYNSTSVAQREQVFKKSKEEIRKIATDGADRVEGTLFGNGERTGNVDIVTVAMNMYSHGVDPGLDFSDMPAIVAEYEKVTRMHVYERAPYAGALVFAAFSGSHQDAIAKGMKWREEKNLYEWTVPYLPIDPHDVGREYETDVIRINSQSGKGGIGYILEQNYGYDLPPKMREALGYAVKDVSDHLHKELNPKDVYGIFESEFLNKETPFAIPEAHYIQKDGIYAMVTVTENDITMEYTGKGNGRLDAVSNAIKKGSGRDFSVLTYKEHALETGSTSHAVAYVGLTWGDGETTWGAGQHTDIMVASVKALASAINNHEWRRQSELF